MQIAGCKCNVCGERIVVKVEGAHCPDCEVCFHTACVPKENICPQCGQDYNVAITRKNTQEHVETERTLKRGRRIVLLCALLLVGPLAGLIILFILASMLSSDFQIPWFLVGNFPLTCLIVAALYFGFSWARIWVLVSVALGAVVSASLALNALGTSSLYFAWGLAWLAIYGTVFALIAFSPSASLFLQRQQ